MGLFFAAKRPLGSRRLHEDPLRWQVMVLAAAPGRLRVSAHDWLPKQNKTWKRKKKASAKEEPRVGGRLNKSTQAPFV